MEKERQSGGITPPKKKQKVKYHYSLEFSAFWASTNQKGGKLDAFYAFNNRLIEHSYEDIKRAYKQLEIDKAGKEYQYWPNISTFLNSHFEGYLHRAKQSKKDPDKELEEKLKGYGYGNKRS